jgi:hypothetical protein
VQLLTLGIIGEYISRIYDEVKQRPLFIVQSVDNIGDLPSMEGQSLQERRPGSAVPSR